MKKILKGPLLIAILIGILFIIGQRTPVIAMRVKKQIKPGQSVNQVIEILNNAGKKPHLCCWQTAGIEDPICSNPKRCDFPGEKIKLNKVEQEVQLSVLYMGMGFLHNEFHVIFDGVGKVVFVSDVKRWD
jgi:hypothetical protein